MSGECDSQDHSIPNSPQQQAKITHRGKASFTPRINFCMMNNFFKQTIKGQFQLIAKHRLYTTPQ
jgi:hypothetical protein